ncbi:MAG: hypothetical protein ABIO70_10410 [Pseudomonadota bacterium]
MSKSARLACVALALLGCAPEDSTVIDHPPTVSIQVPLAGATLVYGQLIAFRAVVSDDLTPSEDLRVLWTSDLDGVLGSAAPYVGEEDLAYATTTTGRLSPGAHRVTLSVLDSGGVSTSQAVEFTVVRNHEPQASISQPAGEEVEYGAPVTLVGSVSDEEDEPNTLDIAWTSDRVGLLDSTPADSSGRVGATATDLPVGLHLITLTVRDSLGDLAQRSVALTVVVREVCNGWDDDGDGLVDEGFDVDGDTVPDCFDAETCDGRDNDGDGAVDEGFEDADQDGTADCVDPEECDGLDNDGDGLTDEGFVDTDGDGLKDCVDRETCGDGVDNDGDGLAEEGCP